MDWSVFWIVLAVGIGFVALQGICAYIDGYFTRAQMLRVHELQKGNSFLQHGGMWADVFVITPLVAYITSKDSLDYSSLRSEIFLGATVVFWWIAGKYFRSLPLPEAHNHNGHTTLAGWIHLGFGVAVTWTLSMFYFSHPPMHDLIVASTLLTPFFFLGIWKIDKDWRWNPVAVLVVICCPAAVWSVVAWRWFFD